MKIALFIVTALGIIIGLAVPQARPVAQPAPVVQASPQPDQPIETVLERRPNGHFVAVADVNRQPVHFIVDTGADIVALTQEDARRAHVSFDPTQFEVVGRGAAGDVRGQDVRIASIVLDGKRAEDIRAVVLEGADISLLGQSYLRRLSEVHIQRDKMVLR